MIEKDISEIKEDVKLMAVELTRIKTQQGDLLKYVVVGLLAIVGTIVGLNFALP